VNRAGIREKALRDLEQAGVLMRDGHFDFGNGYHGRAYVNPHQLFRQPSTIWRVTQDLLDVIPLELLQQVEVVAGPVTGGALLAHTMAGLLDSRRSLTHPPCLFAPFNYDPAGGFALRPFYRGELAGRRVLLVDDVRNTGQTFARCASLIGEAGGSLVATSRSPSSRPPTTIAPPTAPSAGPACRSRGFDATRGGVPGVPAPS
jgi:orotate phosphoribosyltransferase